MRESKLCFVLLAMVAIHCSALNLFADTNTVAPSASPLSFYSGNPFEITAEAGTTGYGGSANWRFANHFGVRGGFDYLHYTLTRSQQDVSYKGSLRLESEPTALDIYPSKNSSFHISVGALWNQMRLTGTGQPNSSKTITLNGDDYTFNPGSSLDLEVHQPRVMPYLGIGGDFFYFDKGHHFSLGGELGVAYGRWKTSLNVSGASNVSSTSGGDLNTDVSTEQGKVNRSLNNVPFWPIAKLGFNVSF